MGGGGLLYWFVIGVMISLSIVSRKGGVVSIPWCAGAHQLPLALYWAKGVRFLPSAYYAAAAFSAHGISTLARNRLRSGS
jgi:hypothetical protein